jgi:predicted Kef-type K+ transport protein
MDITQQIHDTAASLGISDPKVAFYAAVVIVAVRWFVKWRAAKAAASGGKTVAR